MPVKSEVALRPQRRPPFRAVERYTLRSSSRRSGERLASTGSRYESVFPDLRNAARVQAYANERGRSATASVDASAVRDARQEH